MAKDTKPVAPAAAAEPAPERPSAEQALLAKLAEMQARIDELTESQANMLPIARQATPAKREPRVIKLDGGHVRVDL